MAKKSSTVSFRADAELRTQIDKQCGRLGISRGDWSRAVVMAHLESLDQPQLANVLAALHDQIDQLVAREAKQTRALKRLAYATLTSSTPLDKQQAKQIVTKLFENS